MPPEPSIRAHLWVLLFAISFGILTWLGLNPPPVRDDSTPKSEFSGQRALFELQAINPEDLRHPVASPEQARVRERLFDRLVELGLSPKRDKGFSCGPRGCSQVENLWAKVPGRDPGPAWLLVSHFDSRASASGAADDGAGVAACLEVARALLVEPAPHEVILLFTDGEEGGLHGAHVFARNLAKKLSVGAVINLEARGTRGPSLLFETSGSSRGLIRRFAQGSQSPVASSLYDTLYRALPNDTDLTVFRDGPVPGVNFAFLEGVSDYHTPRDRLENLDPRSLQHHGENLLALLREPGPLPPEEAGTEIFFDLFGRVLVHGPAAGAWILAGVGFLGLLARTLTGVGLRAAAGASLGLFFVGVATTLGSAGVHGLGILLGAVPHRWIAFPQVLLASQWILGAALALGLGAWMAGRFGRGASTLVFWLGAALLGLATAASAPGLSYLFWLPALVALVSLPGGASRDSASSSWGFLPAAVLALLWMPHLLLLEPALGLRIAGIHGVVAAGMVFPFALGLPALPRRGLGGLSALALMLGLGAVLVPKFSETATCPLTLAYVEDADRGQARFELRTPLKVLPKGFASFGFRPTGTRYGGLHSRAATHQAKASPLGLSPPQVEGLRQEILDQSVRTRFELRATQKGRRLGVILLPGTQVLSLNFQDQLAFAGDSNPLPARRSFVARIPFGESLRVELQTSGKTPKAFEVFEIQDRWPEAFSALKDARPPWALETHDCDQVQVRRTVPSGN